MLVIPAVDIRGGRCVRWLQGKPERETIYAEDPVLVAQRWQGKGAKRLHVADLDGALSGKLQNGGVIRQLLGAVTVPVQVGGGIRDLSTIRELLAWGVATVILGTLAVENPEVVRQAVSEFGGRLMVSIDVAGHHVVTSGWTQRSAKSGIEVAEEMRILGVKELVVTDTERDGTLTGLNVEALRQFARQVKLPVVVAGGVAGLEDLRRLKALEPEGIIGVIIGKALYEGTLQLEDAIRIGES
ncbi:MAG: 1-(5-phosphoribosyl)-5-[(5-phosphoribosylamino)methylideneamino]imidazole-4-carboxamide isomerase [Elusimicrobia bacterium]|nr:1-(5-phosphoribosyl)-5-[(5-phosphoribosylamino)methylideneamino]imidazole-4-carboxamide isomerase [Elusimicrobiota bacterium]